MDQEIVVYGKNNPGIVPEIDIWGLPISIYLFLGGLAAGVLFFTSLSYLLNRKKNIPRTFQKAAQYASWALIVGVVALLFDLHKILNSWRLYTHFDLTAPMSWGAWILLAIIPLAIFWGAPYHWHFLKRNSLKTWIEKKIERFRTALAFVISLLALSLGLYTGLLLSAFTARPLWDSNTIPFIFLISGLSSGAAVLIWIEKNKVTKERFKKIDLGLILVELVLFLVYIIDLFNGSNAQVAAIESLVAGEFALVFWALVILAGLIIPAIFEWKNVEGFPKIAAPVLILIGGLIFRVLIVEAGQSLMI